MPFRYDFYIGQTVIRQFAASFANGKVRTMKIRTTLFLLLGLVAAVSAIIGCGSAPAASQPSEPANIPDAAPQASEPATPEPSQPVTTMFQADSEPPKVTQPMASEPEAAPVEVGYKVGMMAPEFGMSLYDGTRVTSASLAEQGKPTFIYFHATW